MLDFHLRHQSTINSDLYSNLPMSRLTHLSQFNVILLSPLQYISPFYCDVLRVLNLPICNISAEIALKINALPKSIRIFPIDWSWFLRSPNNTVCRSIWTLILWHNHSWTWLQKSHRWTVPEKSVEPAEGRTAHNNGWNGANGLQTMCLLFLIPFHIFRSSHYHEPVLPN